MKKLFLVIVTAVFLTGCASINLNPATGEVSYFRLGDQHIQGLKVIKNEDGTFSVKLEGQQSEAQALTEAIRIIGVLAPAPCK